MILILRRLVVAHLIISLLGPSLAFANTTVSVAQGQFQVSLGARGQISVQAAPPIQSNRSYSGDELFIKCQQKIADMAKKAQQARQGGNVDLSTEVRAHYQSILLPIAQTANPMLQQGQLEQGGLESVFSTAHKAHQEYLECIDVFNVSGLRDYSKEDVDQSLSNKENNLYEGESQDLLGRSMSESDLGQIKNLVPECRSRHAQTQDYDQCMDFLNLYRGWRAREAALENESIDNVRGFQTQAVSGLESSGTANVMAYRKQIENTQKHIAHFNARIEHYNQKIMALKSARDNIPTPEVLKRHCMQGVDSSSYMQEYFIAPLTPLSVQYSGNDQKKCEDEEFLNRFLENQQMIEDANTIINLSETKIRQLKDDIAVMEKDIKTVQKLSDATEGKGTTDASPEEKPAKEASEDSEQKPTEGETAKPEEATGEAPEKPADESAQPTTADANATETTPVAGENPSGEVESTTGQTTTETPIATATTSDTTSYNPASSTSTTSSTPTQSASNSSNSGSGGGGGAALLIGGAAVIGGGAYFLLKKDKEKKEEEEKAKAQASTEDSVTTLSGGEGTAGTEAESTEGEEGDQERSIADIYRGMHEDQLRASLGKPTEEREYSFDKSSKNLFYRFRDMGGITCDAHFKMDTASSTVISVVTEGDDETCESYLIK